MLPDLAMDWPVFTCEPTPTLIFDRCAYCEYLPLECLITMALPYAAPSPPPYGPAFTTVPALAALTVVPTGTAKSWPECLCAHMAPPWLKLALSVYLPTGLTQATFFAALALAAFAAAAFAALALTAFAFTAAFAWASACAATAVAGSAAAVVPPAAEATPAPAPTTITAPSPAATTVPRVRSTDGRRRWLMRFDIRGTSGHEWTRHARTGLAPHW